MDVNERGQSVRPKTATALAYRNPEAPEWLATEDDLPEPGRKALVFVLDYRGSQVAYRTPEGLGAAIADLACMGADCQAMISVQALSRQGIRQLGLTAQP